MTPNLSLASAASKFRRGYSGARPDIVRLIDVQPHRVLDVGCGAGMTGALIREGFPEVVTVGVEPDPSAANLARARMTLVIEGKIDDDSVLTRLAREQSFDLIVCADVLEHLADPQTVLRALTRMLAPDGRIITSIPNVRHISTFVSLGLFGTWPGRDRGIHDRTHLRFFARKNILGLGAQVGLRMMAERRNLRLIESKTWTMVPAKLLDFWPLRGFFTFQYLHRWMRNSSQQNE